MDGLHNLVAQGAWSILQCDLEGDIIPMAREEGGQDPSLAMNPPGGLTRGPAGTALASWNVLGAGKIRTDAEEERHRQTGEEGVLHVAGSRDANPRHSCRTYGIQPRLGAPSGRAQGLSRARKSC